MNPRQTEGTRTLTVLQEKGTTRSEGRLLKVTIYPWGVEFDLPPEEGQE